MLDLMHRAKIRMSRLVYVVNLGGYIGESTRGEIEYATEIGIPVEYDDASGGTCRMCHQPFDPADTRFDGRAEDQSAPCVCRSCVDRCHDSDDASHRRVIRA